MYETTNQLRFIRNKAMIQMKYRNTISLSYEVLLDVKIYYLLKVQGRGKLKEKAKENHFDPRVIRFRRQLLWYDCKAMGKRDKEWILKNDFQSIFHEFIPLFFFHNEMALFL